MDSTLKEIADELNLSLMSVSRALHGHRGVSEITRRRVQAAAQAVGYRPNHVARALVTGRTQTLGVMVRNFDTFVASRVLIGVEAGARGRGYTILPALHEDDPDQALAALTELTARRMDGIISLSARSDAHAELLNALPATQLPFALAFSSATLEIPAPAESDAADVVVPDQIGGALLATAHLLDQGRQRVAFIGGQEDRSATRLRLEGYRRAHRERGIEPDAGWIRFGKFQVGSGEQIARELLETTTDTPNAIFAADDNIAAGVLRACRRAGRRVPEDVAVIGFNNMPLCEAVDPALSSVFMPLTDVGRQCVHRLIDRVEGPEKWSPQAIVLPCRLVLRESA